jgi:hypothetical protein
MKQNLSFRMESRQMINELTAVYGLIILVIFITVLIWTQVLTNWIQYITAWAIQKLLFNNIHPSRPRSP